MTSYTSYTIQTGKTVKDNAGEKYTTPELNVSLIVFLKVLQSQYETGMIVCQAEWDSKCDSEMDTIGREMKR